MARIRSIKPDFFVNDEMAEHDPLVRLFFIGLWTQADREGRMQDRPKRLKVALLPYDECDVDAILDSLVASGHIVRYSVGDERFIQISNFTKHQVPHHKEVDSEIPEPMIDSTMTQARPMLDSTMTTGREGKGREGSIVVEHRSMLPQCLNDRAWKFDGSEPLSSAGHILHAIERKTDALVVPKDVGLIGDALRDTCPDGCTGKSSRDCAIYAIDKIMAAHTIRKAADFIRADRKGA